LNAIAIYGANGSGKSNLLKALKDMCYIILTSVRTSSTTKLPYDPFLLREGFDNMDTSFEIVFVANNSRYRYGFSYNQDKISKEWLFRKITGRETKLFERDDDVIDVGSGIKSSAKIIDLAINTTRDNTLFLSVCDMLNIEEAKTILKWLSKLNIINGQQSSRYKNQTTELLSNQNHADKIKNYIKSICLNIQDIEVKQYDDSLMLMDYKIPLTTTKVLAHHTIYDSNANPTNRTQKWDFDERESSGSQKALHLIGPILKTLINGNILVIDEIEAFLHPIMTLNIIEIFTNPETNPKKAQIIFATHDTNLLSYAKLRRDQIYFTEKNKWESTELFSLSDFKYYGEKNGKTISESERPDVNIEKRYIEGRYGAIPILGEFNQYIRSIWQEEEN
jgi:AAA15 family ATPase/GTPase